MGAAAPQTTQACDLRDASDRGLRRMVTDSQYPAEILRSQHGLLPFDAGERIETSLTRALQKICRAPCEKSLKPLFPFLVSLSVTHPLTFYFFGQSI